MSGSTTFEFVNNFSTTLSSAIGPSDTTVSLGAVLNATPSASSPIVLTFNDKATGTFYEIVHVIAVSGNNLTIVRGQEGTNALGWAAGDYAFSGPTAGQMQSFVQAPELSGYATEAWVSNEFALINGNTNETFNVAPGTGTQAIQAKQAAEQFASIGGTPLQTFQVAFATEPFEAPQWIQVQNAIADILPPSATSFIKVGEGELLTVPDYAGPTIATVYYPAAGGNVNITVPSAGNGPILFIASDEGFDLGVGTVTLTSPNGEYQFVLTDGSTVNSIVLDNPGPYQDGAMPICTLYSSSNGDGYVSTIIHTRPVIWPAVAANQAVRLDQLQAATEYANFSMQHISESGVLPAVHNVVTLFFVESSTNISLSVEYAIQGIGIISNRGQGSVTLTADTYNAMWTQDGTSTQSFTINQGYSSTTLLIPTGEGPIIVPLANPIVLPATANNQAAQWGQVQTAISALENNFLINYASSGGVSSGYAKIPFPASPSKYLILQWGQLLANTSSNTTPVTFPIAFPNLCFDVFCQEAVGSSSVGAKNPYLHNASDYTLTGCTVYSCSWNGSANEWSGSATGTIMWRALGW